MLRTMKQRPTSFLQELGSVPCQCRHLRALAADLIQLHRQRPPSTIRAQRFSAATQRAPEYVQVQRSPHGTLRHQGHTQKCSRKFCFGKRKHFEHWVLDQWVLGPTPPPACARQRPALSASTHHTEMRRRRQNASSRSELTLGSRCARVCHSLERRPPRKMSI
jgi:hypothetical protein